MASALISNPVTNSDRARESLKRRKKKKQLQATRDQAQSPNGGGTQWKSEAQQQVYSSKLLQALRQVPLSSSSSSSPRRGRAVREAADRVLAATAKGRTRWSRAILTNRLKLKFMKNKRRRVVAAAATGNHRPRKPRVNVLRLKSKNLPAVQRKVRVLGRLVPGCRKEPLPVILEEASDYIAALQMQIKAMTALAELFSGSTRLPPS
ncbi:transcription factor bHLH147 [Diospyros lotus]|uniref:transcription factor bHLH147 n=1 Tax=Diospyros lotus TaxID=55363 RepID=UPI002254C127|nr:transcription factor bHLH147 [Diospyros lotus]XP_052206443.1 transcription factor bHLH147 [Diospyros lotus]